MSLRVRPKPSVAAGSAYRPPPTAPALHLDLSGNEGDGPTPAFIAETMGAWAPDVRRYPSPAGLTAQIAALHGVSPDQVVLTTGADDALDRVCRVVLEPGRSAVLPVPTFEMIERYVAVLGARALPVPVIGPIDAAAIAGAADATTVLVAMVSPNNPTGCATPLDSFLAVADGLPHALILADLAYVEFADEDPTPALRTRPNIVVVRTLSKAWGLASLRVGFAIADPTVAGWIRAAAGPYGVTGPSLAIAGRWLEHGGAQTRAYIDAVRVNRAALARQIRDAGWTAPPSQANFVTVIDPRAPRLGAALLDRGVRVRTWPSDPSRSSFARITVPSGADDLSLLHTALAAALDTVSYG